MIYVDALITDDGDVCLKPYVGTLRATETPPAAVLCVNGSSKALDRAELERLVEVAQEALE